MKSFNKIGAVIALLLGLMALNTANAVEIKAPLGLTWGMSKAQVKAMGVRFSVCDNGKPFEVCKTQNPPTSISFAEGYGLYFHTTAGLNRVGIVGKDITDDITGSEGKALYDSVKTSLIKKYGNPSSEDTREIVGLDLYDEYDEFYQCLAYSGCGDWNSWWKGSHGNLALSLALRGKSRGVGYLSLSYSTKEFWKLRDEYEAKTTAGDERGL